MWCQICVSAQGWSTIIFYCFLSFSHVCHVISHHVTSLFLYCIRPLSNCWSSSIVQKIGHRKFFSCQQVLQWNLNKYNPSPIKENKKQIKNNIWHEVYISSQGSPMIIFDCFFLHMSITSCNVMSCQITNNYMCITMSLRWSFWCIIHGVHLICELS